MQHVACSLQHVACSLRKLRPHASARAPANEPRPEQVWRLMMAYMAIAEESGADSRDAVLSFLMVRVRLEPNPSPNLNPNPKSLTLTLTLTSGWASSSRAWTTRPRT